MEGFSAGVSALLMGFLVLVCTILGGMSVKLWEVLRTKNAPGTPVDLTGEQGNHMQDGGVIYAPLPEDKIDEAITQKLPVVKVDPGKLDGDALDAMEHYIERAGKDAAGDL